MTDEEADFMPFDKVQALMKVWKKRERRKDMRNAELICAIYRAQGAKCKVSDLLPPDEDDPKPVNDRKAFIESLRKQHEKNPK